MDAKYSAVMYKVFYLCIKFVFIIYQFINDNLRKLKNKLFQFGHEFVPVNKSETLLLNFEKLPKHLTVLLGAEEPSLKDLRNLILWCLAARISFVSFYDQKGSLKKHEEELHLVVEEMKNASDHVVWHSGPSIVYKNGFVGRKIHVKVLSGDNSIVELTKHLASSRDRNIDVNRVDELLKKQFEFPDPDLGVCCGKTLRLYGYPPWQIRLTEFLLIPSHHSFSLDNFVELLRKYNQCEQRFGK